MSAIETVEIDGADLRADWHALNSAQTASVDFVSLGNPHFSLTEYERLAALCRGRTEHPAVGIVVTCGPATHERAQAAGLVSALEAFGVRFVTDTCWCMIQEPLIPRDAATIMTNSARYAHYGPGLTGRVFHCGSLAACVEAVCDGRPRPPAWPGNSVAGRATAVAAPGEAGLLSGSAHSTCVLVFDASA